MLAFITNWVFAFPFVNRVICIAFFSLLESCEPKVGRDVRDATGAERCGIPDFERQTLPPKLGRSQRDELPALVMRLLPPGSNSVLFGKESNFRPSIPPSASQTVTVCIVCR
jgi:hypothetical protein